jgi:hypothetical protein
LQSILADTRAVRLRWDLTPSQITSLAQALMARLDKGALQRHPLQH